ncbi:unnamed protein product [Dovyalis caffra]|uniref:Fibronectin type III-like domain-containing protein n=1 Tax=Dovyalis caffra TaxID=77055 RepID=A0AAV1QUU8_9ROSI|nr:unnamed protein product [Dovyalis caffra]
MNKARQLFTADVTPSGSNFTYVCDPTRASALGLEIATYPFCDTSIPYSARAKDLVSRMTLEEKVQQIRNTAGRVPRLGLPFYEWWNEGLHGVANTDPGTIFDDLRISTEARAIYNLGRGGLTYWNPNMNVVRDPRWGKAMETPGEDPFIATTYAVNYVRGLQDFEGTRKHKDLDSAPLKISACCKHYVAYDLKNWQGNERYRYDAKVTEQDMAETYVGPFETCVKDGFASSLMCSYNAINGIPTCADPKLLNQTVRGQWNFQGYIVSDCDAVKDIAVNDKYIGDTSEDAIGTDLNCGDYYPKYAVNEVKQGKVKVEDIDSNIELAAEAARQGIVLLKNDNGSFPFSSANIKNLAVIGPHANATYNMLGNYAFDAWRPSGRPCRFTTPIDGLSAYATVSHAAALDTAKTADATVLAIGLNASIETETTDRVDLLLPAPQIELIKRVTGVSKGPVIIVLYCSGSVDIDFVYDVPQIKAILWAGYPGEEGGRAIADIIFGQYNLVGKFPGRTYRFFDGPTVFPFGYGLSYTRFTYKLTSSINSVSVRFDKSTKCRDIEYSNKGTKPECPGVLTEELKCKEHFRFEILVHNVGSRDGSETVLVYSKPQQGFIGTHLKRVIGFQKVFVPIGSSRKVKFVLNACKSLAIVNYAAYTLLPSGSHSIAVGDGDGAVTFPVRVTLGSNNSFSIGQDTVKKN